MGGGLNSRHLWVNVYTICLSFLNDLIGQYAFSINLIKNIFKCLCLMSANLKLLKMEINISHCLLLSGYLFNRLCVFKQPQQFILLAQRSWCHIDELWMNLLIKLLCRLILISLWFGCQGDMFSRRLISAIDCHFSLYLDDYTFDF